MRSSVRTLVLLMLAAYPGITPVFTASVTTGVAPFAVLFDGSGTTAGRTSRPDRDCLYGFDSGDAASGNYIYGTRPGQSKRKTLGGPTGGHVYETPGTYTATMYVWDGFGHVKRTITIVVQDPDIIFSGTNTICCSTSGTFTGAPSGSSNQTVANLAAALAFLATGKRVLLQTADAWSMSATFSLTGTKDNMVLGSFGTGRAVVTLTSSAILFNMSSGSVTRFQSRDIEVNGSSGASYVLRAVTGLTLTGIHLHNIYTYDIGGLYVSSGSNLARNLSISNCQVERIKGGAGFIGVFASSENFMLIDTRINDTTAAEHCFRSTYMNKGFINGSEFINPAVNKNALTLRPPLWAGGTIIGVPANTYSQYITVSDNKIASNTPYIAHIGPQSSASDERIRRVIFEKNYVYALGTSASTGLALSSFECTSRNNVYNLTGGSVYCNGVFVIGDTQFTADANESWNDTVYSSSVHTEVDGFGTSTGVSTNNKLKCMLQYTPSATTAALIGATAIASTTGTNNSTNANAKTLNPLFNGTLTAIEGFALGAGSPYATFAVLGSNFSDAQGKIRGSNGGAMMLASNATSAWDLFGPP